jgi:glycosyltransferase involved in cell wall biosynthesis
MKLRNDRILVVTVARNEEISLNSSIRSILAQTLQPIRIVIVDDRSIDHTFEVANSLAKKNLIISVVRRISNSKVEHSEEIPKAFNNGLKSVSGDWDFLAKVDADIILDPNYFDIIINAFQYEPRLGIAGGRTTNEPTVTVRGANRVIRRQCWETITPNGLMPEIDVEDSYIDLKATYKGWYVRLVPEAKSIHLRPTGEWTNAKILKHRWRIGVTCYRFGWNPILFIGRVIRIAVFERPRVVTVFPMFLGWLWAFIHHYVIDEELRQWQFQFQGSRVSEVVDEFFTSPIGTMRKISKKQV